MSTPIIVGVDGTPGGAKALAYAKTLARSMKKSELILCYVIEWSPYSFQTPEENEQRHRRREEEITIAHERVLNPALSAAKEEGFTVSGIVRHGDAAEILEKLAEEKGADQIVVARAAQTGIRRRIFGSVTGNLVAHSTVPVTVIPT